jgi:hypothetical protein
VDIVLAVDFSLVLVLLERLLALMELQVLVVVALVLVVMVY